MARGSRRHGRRWLARACVLGGALALSLLAAELGVRLALPAYDPRNQVIYERNAEGLRLGVPLKTTRQGTPKGDFFVTMSFNRLGFRDGKDLARSSGEEIFVVGDSQSFGWGVEEAERFSSRLETELGVPVYNIAMPNNEFRGYARLLDFAERHGARIRNLVIGVCMENDLLDYDTVPYSDELHPASAGAGFRARLWVQTHSALWMCASFTLQRHDLARSLAERAGLARSVDELTRANVADPAAIGASVRQLAGIARRCRSVVLVIPSRALWHGRHTAAEAETHTRFVEGLREAGVAVVDMKPVLEERGEPARFYFAHDPHWTKQAHAAAAAALSAHIRSAEGWPHR